MYGCYDGSVSTVTFPDLERATEWLDTTQELKTQMDTIIEDSVINNEDVLLTHVVDWVRRYIRYLRRWGEDMVAVDVRRAVENSNASLPDNLRLEIPTMVPTARNCRMTIVNLSNLRANAAYQ